MTNTDRWADSNQNGDPCRTASDWTGSCPVNRRIFFLKIAIGLVAVPVATATGANESSFSNLLAQLAEDPSIVEKAWLFQIAPSREELAKVGSRIA